MLESFTVGMRREACHELRWLFEDRHSSEDTRFAS
jgi:hypothetical protein